MYAYRYILFSRFILWNSHAGRIQLRTEILGILEINSQLGFWNSGVVSTPLAILGLIKGTWRVPKSYSILRGKRMAQLTDLIYIKGINRKNIKG